MKLALAAVSLVVSLSSVAWAGDSTWLLCKGMAKHGADADAELAPFVANLHEHRGASGDARDLDVTLIYGVHVSHGVIDGKKAGDFTAKAVALKAQSTAGKQPVTFEGTALVGKNMAAFTMTGKIDWTFGDDPKAAKEAFTANLQCDNMDTLAAKVNATESLSKKIKQ